MKRTASSFGNVPAEPKRIVPTAPRPGELRRLDGAPRRCQHLSSGSEEGGSLGGQLDMAVGPLEQRDAQAQLEFAHVPADGRLSHVQSRRGAPEMKLVRDCHENLCGPYLERHMVQNSLNSN